MEETEGAGKLSTSRLAEERLRAADLQELTDHLGSTSGAIEISEGQKQITPLGRRLGSARVAGECALRTPDFFVAEALRSLNGG